MPWCSAMPLQDRQRELVLLRHLDAVLHVRLDDARGHRRRELLVAVLALRDRDVLDEELRPAHLADVVVVAGDLREQRVGADRLGGLLGQVPDHHAVVVGAGRAQLELAQQRLLAVGELEQLHVGRVREQPTRPAARRRRPARRTARPRAARAPTASAPSSGEKWLPSRSSASTTTAFASPTRSPARSSVPRCATRAAPTAAVSEPGQRVAA